MRNARRQLAASPVLIGAVTVLVAIVAVFISYSANQGLPFVPTYKLNAEIPNGAKLVPGNEVRAGGFRVGVVDAITVVRRRVDGRERSVARLELKLDKKIEPLSVDTRVGVRPRSALGLKYVELIPGRARRTFQNGATVPLRNASAPAPELEDVLSTFTPETRRDAQKTLIGFGDAFAGRGEQINETIQELRPFLVRLEPVMRNLSDPRSELRNLVPALAAAAGQVAPVAEVQARLFGELGDTFAALNRDPRALQETIAETPATLAASTASFRVQTPFLARFADVSRRLGPGAAELRRALQVTRPALEDVAPYQTVCNYLVYFFNPLGTHISESVPGGTMQRIKAKLTDLTQANTLGTTESLRPVDVPTDKDPNSGVLQALHTQYGGPAVDAKGNADCQSGQTGYPSRLVTNPRWPADSSAGGFVGGGSHVVLDNDTPGLAGGTYKARELGIDNLKDVP